MEETKLRVHYEDERFLEEDGRNEKSVFRHENGRFLERDGRNETSVSQLEFTFCKFHREKGRFLEDGRNENSVP